MINEILKKMKIKNITLLYTSLIVCMLLGITFVVFGVTSIDLDLFAIHWSIVITVLGSLMFLSFEFVSDFGFRILSLLTVLVQPPWCAGFSALEPPGHSGRVGKETVGLVISGEFPFDRVPLLEQARRFHDSPEYAAARRARQGIATMNMLARGRRLKEAFVGRFLLAFLGDEK